jgi:hypothetical protein
MMKMGNNLANDDYTMHCKAEGIKIHPARCPAQLPKFFIKLMTEPNNLVLDPFLGVPDNRGCRRKTRASVVSGRSGGVSQSGIFRFEESENNPKLF